jgi:hypothetical protein
VRHRGDRQQDVRADCVERCGMAASQGRAVSLGINADAGEDAARAASVLQT